jgi:hypothetical protein
MQIISQFKGDFASFFKDSQLLKKRALLDGKRIHKEMFLHKFLLFNNTA